MLSISHVLVGCAFVNFAAAQSAFDILATYCPCAPRATCPRFFGENEDVISRQILAVLPPCQINEVRCCVRDAMFTAIDTILGSGTGRSLGGAGVIQNLGTAADGLGRSFTILEGRNLGLNALDGRQLGGQQAILNGRQLGQQTVLNGLEGRTLVSGLGGIQQQATGRTLGLSGFDQGRGGVHQHGLGVADGRSLGSILAGRTLDTLGQLNLQGRDLGVGHLQGRVVDPLTLPRVAPVAPATTVIQGPAPTVSLPRQAPGPVAPSVTIVGPAPVYISDDVVQGPSDQGAGVVSPGFVGRSGEAQGTLTPEARTLINLLKESLRGSTAGRTLGGHR